MKINVIKPTSFGSLEPLKIEDGNIILELATFTSNGRAHKHNVWEICTVLKGSGRIMQLVNGVLIQDDVKVGSVVKIPPNTEHWMEIDDEEMHISLAYTHNY